MPPPGNARTRWWVRPHAMLTVTDKLMIKCCHLDSSRKRRIFAHGPETPCPNSVTARSPPKPHAPYMLKNAKQSFYNTIIGFEIYEANISSQKSSNSITMNRPSHLFKSLCDRYSWLIPSRHAITSTFHPLSRARSTHLRKPPENCASAASPLARTTVDGSFVSTRPIKVRVSLESSWGSNVAGIFM